MCTKERFKQSFYPEMAELAQDIDPLVRIEGIELMTEFLTLIKKQNAEQDFLPNVEEILTIASDPLNDHRVRVRIAMICGKILDRLGSHFSQTRFGEMFIEYFKTIIVSKDEEV